MTSSLALCPVQAACGGCPLMPMSLDAQRAHKLKELERVCHLQGVVTGPIELTQSPASVGYRNRIRLRLEAGRVLFFNAQKQPSCAVLEPALRRCLDALLRLSAAEPARFAPFAHLELRSPDARGRPGLALALHDESRDVSAELAWLAQALPEHVIGLRGDPHVGCQEQRFDLGWQLVPLDAFWQINAGVNRLLVRRVLQLAQRVGARHALDLYAGAGNFSLPLAASGIEVIAVESHAPAVAACARAAAAQGFDCRALVERAERAAERFATEGRAFDLALVDAPRAGAQGVIPALARLRPPTVLVCSCNPTTLSRDLAALIAAGYRLDSLEAFDMFPHTHHLETLAHLTTA